VIPRVDQSPKIDGYLSDDIWSKAASAEGFLIAGTDKFAKQQTKARILFTDKALYLAFDCDDTQTASLEEREHGGKVWHDDSVEVFLSPQRKLNEVYHLILNVNGVKTWKRASADKYGPGNSWQAAVRKRPGGWTAEMAVPFEAFLEQGLYPRRGDLWGVKLMREDYTKPRAPAVELSSWTRIGKSFHDPSAFGDLVFESRNLFVNGGAEKDMDKDGLPDGWKFSDYKKEQPAKVELDDQIKYEGKYSLRSDYKTRYQIQPAGGYPLFRLGTTYKFSARLRLRPSSKSTFVFFNIGPNKMQIPPSEEFKLYEVYYKYNGPEGPPLIWLWMGEGTLWIDDVRLEVVREYEEPGTLSLTGNATGDLKKHNIQTGGAYTYYEGYTFAQFFPYYPLDQTEPGRSSGWVPFRAGRLTDGDLKSTVSWPHWWMSRNGVAIECDLKDDYLIKKIEVYSPNSAISDCIIFLKPSDAAGYVRTSALAHPNVRETQARGYVNIVDINARARWVRLNLVMFKGQYPAVSEVLIWGEKIEDDTPAPLPKPCALPGERKTEPTEMPIIGDSRAISSPVFPIPQEFWNREGHFSITSRTKIVIASAEDKRARATAEVLRDEIKNDTDMEVSISALSELPEGVAKNIIVLGEPAKVALLATELKKANRSLPQDTPGDQGYVLDITPERILIAGRSSQGTFYGSMSLLQLLKEDKGQWSVSSAAIRDWPDQQYRCLKRLLPASRALTERVIRTLARYKINYVMFEGEGQKAEVEIVPLAEKYFIGIIPDARYAAGLFAHRMRYCGLTERNPGESMTDLSKISKSGQNPCPSDPRVWQEYEKMVSERLPKYNSDLVDVAWNWPHRTDLGARWNVCPLCRQRNMHGHELLAWTINKIQSILEKHGKRPIFFTNPVAVRGISYPEDEENDWRKAQDLVSKEVIFYVYNQAVAGNQLAAKGFTVLDWYGFLYPPTIEGQQGVWFNAVDTNPLRVDYLLGMVQTTWSFDKIKYDSQEYYALIEQQAAGYNALVQGVESPLWRTGEKKFFTIDIRSAVNRSLIDEKAYDGRGWIDEGPTRDLRALKPGRRVLAGVPFRIIAPGENKGKQCVMLHNRGYFNRSLPERVTIPLGRKASSLIFLHTLNRTPAWTWKYRRDIAGFYIIAYKDGTCDKVRIRYNRNISNWDILPGLDDWGPRTELISNGFRAWKGTTLGGEQASLYATEWVNPYPDRPIDRIIFVATPKQQPFSPILLAVTGIEPTQRDLDLWRDKKVKLSHLAYFTPQQRPAGKLIDLTGGVNKSDEVYIAPNGMRIEFDNTIYNDEKSFTVDYWNYAGNIVTENNWGVANNCETQTISIILPEPRILSCVGIFGRPTFEDQWRLEVPTTTDYRLEISPDGKDFHAMGSVTKYIPEEQGWRYHGLDPQPVKQIRITVSKEKGKRANGIACIRLYEPD